jgi:hypothetical protein
MNWILERYRTPWLVAHAVLFIIVVPVGSWIALIFLAGLLIGGWYNPPNVKPAGSKQKWLSVIVPTIVLLLVFVPDNNESGLKLELSPSGFLVMKNVSTQPIKIMDISFNDRADCKPRVGLLSASPFKSPTDLKVGDFLLLSSTCALVRTTIQTDKRSFTYHFD